MPIALSCPCGRALRVKDALAGKRIRCPECSQVLSVPELDAAREEEAVEALLADDGVSAGPPPKPRDAVPYAVPVEREPYRPSSEPPRRREKPRERRERRVTFEQGWFGSLNAGMIGGLLMMLIAVGWFVAGLAGGIIFFYPPILFVIGFIAMMKGLMGGN